MLGKGNLAQTSLRREVCAREGKHEETFVLGKGNTERGLC